MRKATWFTSVLLAAALVVTSFAPVMQSYEATVYAEDEYNYDEEEVYDDSEEYEDSEDEYRFIPDPTVDTNEIKGWPQGDVIDADAAVLMEANTGAVLYAKHMDQERYPASITKIMTVLLALEHGNLDDVVTFSNYAVYSIEYGSAHLGLTEGEQLTLEQCLYGIMLASANEISNAVAEYVAGDVDKFADMMNAKAEELGCKHTHFVNPNGLHEEDHYVSAKDMALIMREALKYDKFREIINTDEYHYPPTNLVKEDRYFVNHHRFLMEESYEGIIGGKTGFTDEAFNTLVSAAERDGMTLISVVLHAPGQESEYGDTRTILDYGFDNFKLVEVDTAEAAKNKLKITGIKDEEELAKIKEADFTEDPFDMEEKITLVLPKDAKLSKVKCTMNFKKHKLSFNYNGQVVGSTSFTYTGDWDQAEETEAATDAATLETVEAGNETEAATEAVTEAAVVTEAAETASPVDNDNKDKAEMTLKDKFWAFMDTMEQGVGVIRKLLEGNDMLAVLIGGVLLVIFIPLLILAISRNIRYKKIMRLRVEEMQMRKKLEEEIERQSAAQVEAELRARDLEFQLEMEKKKNQQKEEASAEETITEDAKHEEEE